MSPEPRPTSIPSGILIYAAIWSQRIWAENWGLFPFGWGGAGSPSNTMWPGPAKAYLHAKFHLDPSNSLATIHQRYRQDRTGQTGQTERQRSDSIGQTVLQTVAQKRTLRARLQLFRRTDHEAKISSSVRGRFSHWSHRCLMRRKMKRWRWRRGWEALSDNWRRREIVAVVRTVDVPLIHRESKKGSTLTMAITLSILDGFAKFFHCGKEQSISKKAHIRLPTTPYVCCCITLENLKIRNLHFACT